jgi:hypothetical protein
VKKSTRQVGSRIKINAKTIRATAENTFAFSLFILHLRFTFVYMTIDRCYHAPVGWVGWLQVFDNWIRGAPDRQTGKHFPISRSSQWQIRKEQ